MGTEKTFQEQREAKLRQELSKAKEQIFSLKQQNVLLRKIKEQMQEKLIKFWNHIGSSEKFSPSNESPTDLLTNKLSVNFTKEELKSILEAPQTKKNEDESKEEIKENKN